MKEAGINVVRVAESTWSTMELFFFSSRRRHTRLTCDWSSDVCSSDLRPGVDLRAVDDGPDVYGNRPRVRNARARRDQIGRASCRERVEMSVVDENVKTTCTTG